MSTQKITLSTLSQTLTGATQAKVRTMIYIMAGLGLLLLILGFLTTHPDTAATRFWASFLLGDFFFTAISITAVMWMAITYLSNTGWSIVFKRIHEAIGGFFIIGFILFFIFIIIGIFTDHAGIKAVYEWTHVNSKGILSYEGQHHYDDILHGKYNYLNITFFFIRQIVYCFAWYWFYSSMRKASLREDQDLNIRYYNRSYRFSAGFIPFYAITFCLFGYDWAMSLEPHWYSTMYSVNLFAAALVSVFTFTGIIAFLLKENGYMPYVNENHFHDNGKLIFGFSIFWTYTWVGQFLLIWYANIPEESIFFYTRMHGGWDILFWLNLLLNFAVPFLMLMMRNSKRHFRWLIFVGVLMIIGRFIDWFLKIMPGAAGDKAQVGFIEIGVWLIFAGLFSWVVVRKLSNAPLVPLNHPYLEESLHHEI